MNQTLFDSIKTVLHKKSTKDELTKVLEMILLEESKIYEDNLGKCKMVSLDTATKKSGWAYYEAGELASSGEIDLSKEKDTDIRTEEMVSQIFQLLDKLSPDIVVIEKNVVGRNARTERLLGYIVGSVKGWGVANYKEFTTLSPSVWRKYSKAANGTPCPRKSAEAKQWSIKRVMELFHKKVGDNEADAILVGYALIQMRNIGE